MLFKPTVEKYDPKKHKLFKDKSYEKRLRKKIQLLENAKLKYAIIYYKDRERHTYALNGEYLFIIMKSKKLLSYKLLKIINETKWTFSICDSMLNLYHHYIDNIENICIEDDDYNYDGFAYIRLEVAHKHINKIKEQLILIGNLTLEFNI